MNRHDYRSSLPSDSSVNAGHYPATGLPSDEQVLHMLKLVLAVTLVPSSNSIDHSLSHERPAAIGKTIPIRDLVSLGMTPDEVTQLLGEPSGGGALGFGAGATFGRMEYPKLGVTIVYSGGLTRPETVDRIIKYAPQK